MTAKSIVMDNSFTRVPSTLIATLGQWLKVMTARVSSLLESDRVYTELSRCTDRELEDMGFTREDIADVASGRYKPVKLDVYPPRLPGRWPD